MVVVLYDQESGEEVRRHECAVRAATVDAAERVAVQDALAAAGSRVRDVSWTVLRTPLVGGRLGHAGGWQRGAHPKARLG